MPIMALWARLGLDKTGFDAGLKSAQRQAGKFGSDLKSQLAGAFTLAAATHLARNIVETAEAAGDLSDRLGVSIKDAQDFGLAAKLGGSDVEYFAAKFERLRAALAKPGENPLKDFGITTRDPAQALNELADIISTTGLNAQQATKFVEIFGKGSGKLITVLGDLEKAKLALTFSDDDVRTAQEVADLWGVMAQSSKVLALYAARFAPTLQNMAAWVASSPFMVADMVSGKFVEPPKKTELPEVQDEKELNKQKEETLKIEQEIYDLNEKTRRTKIGDSARLVELKQQEKALVTMIADATEKNDTLLMRRQLAEVQNDITAIENRKTASRIPAAIHSDQFGRIGAFTGSAAQQTQVQIAMRNLTELQKLHAALTRQGILVRGTD